MKLNRREAIKGLAVTVAATAFAQTGIAKAEDRQQDECRLVFDRTTFLEHQYQIVSINPDLVTCRAVHISDEWVARWECRYGGDPIICVKNGEDFENPQISYHRDCGLAMSRSQPEIISRVQKTIAQAVNHIYWAPDLQQITLTVPRWAAEML